MVAGDHEQRPAEPPQQGRGALVLLPPAAVCQVARDRDQFRLNPLHKRLEALLDDRLLDASRVQIGDVEEAHGQRRIHAIH